MVTMATRRSEAMSFGAIQKGPGVLPGPFEAFSPLTPSYGFSAERVAQVS
jgi:hypothetical protein